MKEADFKMRKQHVHLFLKVLICKHRYKDALEFIDGKKSYFDQSGVNGKLERMNIEADLYLQNGQVTLCLNSYFSIFRQVYQNVSTYDPEYNSGLLRVINILFLEYHIPHTRDT